MLRRCRVGGGASRRYSAFAAVLKQWILAGSLILALISRLPGPAAAAEARAAAFRLLVLGDSLTAGYGLAAEEAFPIQLQAALKNGGVDVLVINAGVSGDTTAGGLSRIDWALADNPTHVIVELGANDALRGINPKTTHQNLDAIIAKLQSAGVKTMLAGMYAPPNWGRDYEAEFRSIYPDLARQYRIGLYPFFLDGVAARPTLNQADGIHPNKKGVAVIVGRMLPSVRRLLGAKE